MYYSTHYNLCDDILACLDDDKLPDVSLDDKLAEPFNQINAALNKLETDGYVLRLDNKLIVRGTGEGLIFKRNGGYKNYLLESEETAALTKRKLEIDLKNAKRIYATFWLAIAISIVSFIISGSLLIIKLTHPNG